MRCHSVRSCCSPLSRSRQDSAVPLRVQGLDPPVHHLREAGVVADFGDSDLVFLQQAERAASGQQLNALSGEGAGELNNAGFVGNAD